MRTFLIALFVAAAVFSTSARAGDEELCLDCHEPAEDWEGMSAEEILETASDISIKRHADNADFTTEQLQAMIAVLMGDS